MIIVSQDKNEIVNFKNMNNIIIEDFDFKDKHFKRIKASTDGDYFVLGDYKTEERAKEVLKDIVKSYREYRTAECDGYTNILEETAVYEMPED